MARQRDHNGRFLKTDGQVPADGSDPKAIVILPELDDPGGATWGVRQVSVGFAINLDPAHLVDAMRRAAIARIREAILAGQRPDGGGAQKALSRRALADPDRDSSYRGYKTGELADGVRATAIKTTGTTARSTVLPPTSRTVYVAGEMQRGVVLITGAGAVGEAAAAAARETGAAMARGAKIITAPAEVKAKDAEP